MAIPTDPYNFVPGTTADADQVDARFLPLYTELAGNLDLTNLSTPTKNGFLKLATVADRKVAFGSISTGGFGGNTTLTGTINHGLGLTPVLVLLTPGDIATFAGSNSAVAASAAAFNSTNFSYRLSTANNSGTNFGTNIYWLAIG
jgi:hypothetical protein